jgi:hypothetical protein
MDTPTTPPTTTTSLDAVLTAALAAAARGWYVFPLRPGVKKPALHGYDRCPHTGRCALKHQGWEQRATIDPGCVRAAFSPGGCYAGCNVAIATGPSGLVVLDLDVIKPGDPPAPPDPWKATPGIRDGQDVLAVLAEHAGQELPGDTFTVATPSGGLHLYYRAPVGAVLRNTEGDRGAGLGWKIDTRAHGGYVVAPGSVITSTRTGSGGCYRVLADSDPAPLPAWLPAWLAARLTPTPLPPTPPDPVALARQGRDQRARYLNAAIHGETTKVTSAPASQRNAALYASAVALGQLVAGGELTEDEVRHALLNAAGTHIALGAYNQRQAHSTIASGIRAGANRPRQVAA